MFWREEGRGKRYVQARIYGHAGGRLSSYLYPLPSTFYPLITLMSGNSAFSCIGNFPESESSLRRSLWRMQRKKMWQWAFFLSLSCKQYLRHICFHGAVVCFRHFAEVGLHPVVCGVACFLIVVQVTVLHKWEHES